MRTLKIMPRILMFMNSAYGVIFNRQWKCIGLFLPLCLEQSLWQLFITDGRKSRRGMTIPIHRISSLPFFFLFSYQMVVARARWVSKRCRLSRLTYSALVYEPKCGGGGGFAGPQSTSTAVHRSPNKLWRSNSSLYLIYGCSFPSLKKRQK